MQVMVFPIHNMVLYPSTSKPINVIDFIYKKMIQDAIQRQIPIAMAFLDDPYTQERVVFGQKIKSVREVAGIGIPVIIEERPDGTLLVLIQGRGKVRLKEVVKTTEPYILCEAEKIDETHTVLEENKPLLEHIQNVLSLWVQNNILEDQRRQTFLASIKQPEEVVGVFASFLISDYDMQQIILENNNINEKVQMIYRLIQSKGLIG